ncbi:MAG: tRNA (guanosine(46)-N7)-methyltransferase TrmB [Acidobacteria bacterium]|jgi:tRNA (guanine-N7-)-methyltransferase|nr:tRNA (guanosine(46)-N7)-methyltransferase TrmB [Acidobacteriota bacterium]
MIDVDLAKVAVPLSWPELFGVPEPPDLELGSGNSRFLLELAARRPERSFLAVERAAKYHRLGCDRAARRGITNVRFIRTTAEDLLFRLLPPRSLAAVYVLFPDPWPKKRHHKRRLFKPEIVAAITEALRPGGRLLVKTDFPEYAEVIGEVLEAARGLEWLEAEPEFADLPQSGYEVKYLQEGRRITSFALARLERGAPGAG